MIRKEESGYKISRKDMAEETTEYFHVCRAVPPILREGSLLSHDRPVFEGYFRTFGDDGLVR